MSAEPKLCPMQHNKGTCSHGSKWQAPYTAGHSYREIGSEQSLKPGWLCACEHKAALSQERPKFSQYHATAAEGSREAPR